MAMKASDLFSRPGRPFFTWSFTQLTHHLLKISLYVAENVQSLFTHDHQLPSVVLYLVNSRVNRWTKPT